MCKHLGWEENSRPPFLELAPLTLSTSFHLGEHFDGSTNLKPSIKEKDKIGTKCTQLLHMSFFLL